MNIIDDLRDKIETAIEASKEHRKLAYKATDRAYVDGALFVMNVVLDWLPKKTDNSTY